MSRWNDEEVNEPARLLLRGLLERTHSCPECQQAGKRLSCADCKVDGALIFAINVWGNERVMGIGMCRDDDHAFGPARIAVDRETGEEYSVRECLICGTGEIGPSPG